MTGTSRTKLALVAFTSYVIPALVAFLVARCGG